MQLNTIVALLAVVLGVALTGLSAADVHQALETNTTGAPDYSRADPLAREVQRRNS